MNPLYGTVLLMVTALLLGCGAESGAPEQPADSRVFAYPAPFWAGTFTDSYVRGDEQVVATQVWYPSTQSTGEGVRFDGVFDGESWEDATADCSIPRPVVVFSHGNGGVRWQTAFNMHALATHGFLVVAGDHPTNTFRDNTVERRAHHILDRPLDVQRTFDWLLTETANVEHPLHGCVDRQGGYAVVGHAFGGYTALMVAGATIRVEEAESLCQSGDPTACEVVALWNTRSHAPEIALGDGRVWAVVTFAPSALGGLLSSGTRQVAVPSLTITGTKDALTSVDQVATLVMGMGEADLVHFEDAGHFSFAPVSCLLMSGDGCGEGYMSLSRVQELANRLVSGFLAVQLGWTGAWNLYTAINEPDIEWRQRDTTARRR